LYNHLKLYWVNKDACFQIAYFRFVGRAQIGTCLCLTLFSMLATTFGWTDGNVHSKNVFTNHKLLQYESHHGKNIQSAHYATNMYIAQDFHSKQLQ